MAATTAGGMAGDRQEGAEENTVMHVFDGVLTWLRIGLAAVVVAALALLRRGTQAGPRHMTLDAAGKGIFPVR